MFPASRFAPLWKFLLALGWLTACSSTQTTLAPQAPGAPLEAGASFSVPIFLHQAQNLRAFELHLSFDPALLEVQALHNGGFLEADFVVQNTFDNTAGTIDYAVAQLKGPPVSGEGALLEIVFRPRGSGQAALQFRPIASAPQGFLLSDDQGLALPAQASGVTLWLP